MTAARHCYSWWRWSVWHFVSDTPKVMTACILLVVTDWIVYLQSAVVGFSSALSYISLFLYECSFWLVTLDSQLSLLSEISFFQMFQLCLMLQKFFAVKLWGISTAGTCPDRDAPSTSTTGIAFLFSSLCFGSTTSRHYSNAFFPQCVKFASSAGGSSWAAAAAAAKWSRFRANLSRVRTRSLTSSHSSATLSRKALRRWLQLAQVWTKASERQWVSTQLLQMHTG